MTLLGVTVKPHVLHQKLLERPRKVTIPMVASEHRDLEMHQLFIIGGKASCHFALARLSLVRGHTAKLRSALPPVYGYVRALWSCVPRWVERSHGLTTVVKTR